MQLDDRETIVSMLGFLMAGAIVGAFELTYVRTDINSNLQRWLAHATKFLSDVERIVREDLPLPAALQASVDAPSAKHVMPPDIGALRTYLERNT